MLNSKQAHSHFKKVDPILAGYVASHLQQLRAAEAIKKVDPSQYTFHLYSSIISQQISVKAADAILQRFIALVGDPQDALSVLAHTVEDYRAIGLSRQKASYILSIAELTSNKTVQISHLDTLSNEEVIQELVKIKGVGVWTAEMFLMFTLARPDVFSVGDLGLLNAAKLMYNRPNMTRAELLELSGIWSPYRTTAALLLWHSLNNKPIS